MIIKRIFRPANFLANFYLAEKNPVKIQNRVLSKILKKNNKTYYGNKYNFSKIKSIKEFQKNVPIITYPDIKRSIDLMRNGKQNILVRDKVIYFATSSGTTSEPKFIPITKTRMNFHRGELLLWMRHLFRNKINVLRGKTLYFAGGDLNGYTEAKIPYGNISGYLVRNSSRFVKRKLVVSSDILNIQDFDFKMKKIAILSLLESDISQIAFASAVQAILFFDFLVDNKKKLIKEVKKKNKKRGIVLENLTKFNPALIWPNLWLINCIKSGANKLYLESVKEKMGRKNIVIRDPGILASEGRISLGVTNIDCAGVLPINETFFEFREKIDDGFSDKIMTVEKLKINNEYKVIMTTPEGLYRYDIEDVVRVVGFMKKIPLIRFVSRNKFLNITEEHAPEGEIIRGVEIAIKKLKIKLRSFTIVPYIKKNSKPRYEIFVELSNKVNTNILKNLLKEIDNNWQKNMLTYSETRNEFGRMNSPILSIVKKGNYDKIDSKALVRRGQSKPVNVTEDFNYRYNFDVIKSYKF